ncbi:hypothetical protein [Pseudooceanicola antarcticus]|uniref:hypothetical protein n=1 Tax=Pseudooceanicola antarcticus TaxID=1247613 RepID=UPI0012FE6F3F|nr:hypothetical protein [Pseudooceanicola antarcticus]
MPGPQDVRPAHSKRLLDVRPDRLDRVFAKLNGNMRAGLIRLQAKRFYDAKSAAISLFI